LRFWRQRPGTGMGKRGKGSAGVGSDRKGKGGQNGRSKGMGGEGEGGWQASELGEERGRV